MASFVTETGCRVGLLRHSTHKGIDLDHFILFFDMEDEDDPRTAEVMLTASEMHRLASNIALQFVEMGNG